MNTTWWFSAGLPSCRLESRWGSLLHQVPASCWDAGMWFVSWAATFKPRGAVLEFHPQECQFIKPSWTTRRARGQTNPTLLSWVRWLIPLTSVCSLSSATWMPLWSFETRRDRISVRPFNNTIERVDAVRVVVVVVVVVVVGVEVYISPHVLS